MLRLPDGNAITFSVPVIQCTTPHHHTLTLVPAARDRRQFPNTNHRPLCAPYLLQSLLIATLPTLVPAYG